MKEFAWFSLRLVIFWLGLSVLCPLCALGVDQKETIRHARESYYSLKGERLGEFRCQVYVDWDSMYQDLKTDAIARDQLLPILRKTHFQIVVGPEGSSTVSHQSELAPPNEQVAERVRESITGVEQVLTGFLQTWSVFAVTPPFPAVDSDYQVEDLQDKLRLSYREGSTAVVTLMTRDFAIDEQDVKLPEMDFSIRPRFSQSKKGFVVRGWEANTKPTVGAAQQMSVEIENRSFESFDLPSKINIAIKSPITVHISLTLSDYEVKRLGTAAVTKN